MDVGYVWRLDSSPFSFRSFLFNFFAVTINIFGRGASAATTINSRVVDIVLSSNLIEPDACLLASGFDYLASVHLSNRQLGTNGQSQCTYTGPIIITSRHVCGSTWKLSHNNGSMPWTYLCSALKAVQRVTSGKPSDNPIKANIYRPKGKNALARARVDITERKRKWSL